jgi:uncharacterized protein
MLSLVLAAIIASGAKAQDTKTVHQISVSGTVEAHAAPDEVLWQISLKDTDKNLGDAKKLNDQKVKAVLALREKLKVMEGDLQTGQVSIYREYERTVRGDRGDFKYFVVSRSVTIRQRDLKRFDEFLDALVASTDMEVSFNLESSKIHEVRTQTRLKALQVAKDKAAAMASALGSKVGPVLKIDEYLPQQDRSFASNSNFAISSPTIDQGSETFVPGAISVRVTVFVTFELQ